MTRKRKKHQSPQHCYPERSGQMASGAVAHLVPGSAHQVRKPHILLAVCGLLILAVIVVFGQTARHDFVDFDDKDYVYENWHVRSGLTGAGTAWAITAYDAYNWHPLTWLSHMLDCQIYDLNPAGHHLTNVLLHAAAAVLLLLTLLRMTGALWPSAWVATVFAIHPLRVESIAWVAERKDVLSGLFFMLTVWFYARYVEQPASWGRYVLVMASFALGLTAKPMLVTLPFVLLLLDYWPLGRLKSAPGVNGGRWTVDEKQSSRSPTINRRPLSTSLVRLLLEKIPLFALAAASCVVTLAAQRGAMQSLQQVSFAGRTANAATAYVAYLGKILYPAGLAVLYPLSMDALPTLQVVAAVGVLLAISAAAFTARRKCPYLLFGWLWYLGTLVPVIGLVQVGDQAMADRYTYLTQIGLYAALAWGAAQVTTSWPYCRWPFAVASVLVVAGLIVCAWQQTRHWRDSETLFAHTLACTSQNYSAHNNLGNALARGGQNDAAIAHYREALKIYPGYAEAHNNLGNTLARAGQNDAAIAHYRKALEIKPDYVKARYNLGNALGGRGQFDEAIAHYRKALEINPDFAEAHYNLGFALVCRGRLDEAIQHYQKALALATARNDRELADVIRARIRLLQPAAFPGNAP